MCARADHPPYDAGPLFRSLDDEQETTFRAWAREHYRAGQPINPLWHPVVRDECRRIESDARVRVTGKLLGVDEPIRWLVRLDGDPVTRNGSRGSAYPFWSLDRAEAEEVAASIRATLRRELA